MADPTTTRQALRRLICRQLGMEFFRRYNGVSTLTTGSQTVPADTKLTQAADFWNRSYLFMVDGNAALDVRLITDFTVTTGVITPERALSAVPTSGDSYEIHTLWNAYDLHDAINRAIESGFRDFFDTREDESIVIEEDKLEYSLASMSVLPWVVTKIWREVNSAVLRGTATSGAVGSLTDTNLIGQIASVDTDWKIAIYRGTGKGQLRSVSTANNGTGAIVPTVNWTTAPDSTSQYALWDPTLQHEEWVPIYAARFDQKDWPLTVRFPREFTESQGLRLRLQYLSRPEQLTTEAGTTVVPQDFIIEKSLAYLYRQRLNDTRVDRARYAALADDHDARAELERRSLKFQIPEVTLWQEDEAISGRTYDKQDALDWKGV